MVILRIRLPMASKVRPHHLDGIGLHGDLRLVPAVDLPPGRNRPFDR
jgi:hypothetical protein